MSGKPYFRSNLVELNESFYQKLGVFLENLHVKLGKYRHYKGNEYQVIGTARHSETDEKLVVYRCLYGACDLWVRPLAMFLEQVEVDGRLIKRFEYVSEGTHNF